MVRAVTFDFWNTVMWEEPGSLKQRRLELWAAAFATAGAPQDAALLELAHDRAHCRYEESWHANRQFRVEHAVELVLEALPGPLPKQARELLLEGYDEAGRRAAVHPSEGVESCLRALREAGVRLGIVCDIGLTPSTVVRGLLERHDLLGLFDATTFSDEVGLYKPAAGIFQQALAELGGVAPGRAAHVGDRRRTDVGGALAIGMTTVRYNGVFEDPDTDAPEAQLVTSDLSELPDRLGLPQVTA